MLETLQITPGEKKNNKKNINICASEAFQTVTLTTETSGQWEAGRYMVSGMA